MDFGAILVLLVILVLIASFPAWPYARRWGFLPSGILGLVLVLVLILFLIGLI